MNSLAATLEVKNKLGLHLRAASVLSQVAKDFQSAIIVSYGNQEVNARSVIQLMMLGAAHGAKLKIKVQGPDAAEAMAAIKSLFEQRFNEE
ncbi:MAG TPA: HPr family phosphocarrier protein [Candidatus Binataceae bacterium]|nr:HPr family phosphocarrier protein [Candidatus Binataceae bacterium]